uniref:Uncharacterized protein n=1 Tax=Rhizophora mucronata TaxID=61149 RepID=A0A2P2PT18_RHIMU
MVSWVGLQFLFLCQRKLST